MKLRMGSSLIPKSNGFLPKSNEFFPKSDGASLMSYYFTGIYGTGTAYNIVCVCVHEESVVPCIFSKLLDYSDIKFHSALYMVEGIHPSLTVYLAVAFMIHMSPPPPPLYHRFRK